MRVLILGAGAVGGYLGGRLIEAGRDAAFLVRPRRRAQLAASGLVIRSPCGDVAAPAPAITADEIDRPWDLIVVCCKAYDLASAMDAFAPAVGSGTTILPLLNGMRHLDALDARFGRERVLGGLCSINVTLGVDGAIIHLHEGHRFVFGERSGGDSPRAQAIARLVAPLKAQCSLSLNIVQDMWEKWMLIAALAASTCLFRASTGDIVAAGGADVIETILHEAQAIAASAGHAAPPERLDKILRPMTDPSSSFTASMMRDMEKGGPVEADHVIGDLLARGQAAGVATPLLRLACLCLKAYEARRRRETGGA